MGWDFDSKRKISVVVARDNRFVFGLIKRKRYLVQDNFSSTEFSTSFFATRHRVHEEREGYARVSWTSCCHDTRTVTVRSGKKREKGIGSCELKSVTVFFSPLLCACSIFVFKFTLFLFSVFSVRYPNDSANSINERAWFSSLSRSRILSLCIRYRYVRLFLID